MAVGTSAQVVLEKCYYNYYMHTRYNEERKLYVYMVDLQNY